MRRSIKKAVAFIAFLALTVQLLVPINVQTVYADAGSQSDVSWEDMIDWGALTSIPNTEKVVIPDDLDIDGVSIYSIGEKVKSITVPEGVTYVYLSCGANVKELVLPESLNSISIDGFSSIETITVPESVTNVSVYTCPNLKELKLSKGVEYLYLFGNPKLKVTVPSTVNYLDVDTVSGVTVDKDNPYYSIDDGSLYCENRLIKAADTATLNIKKGTVAIDSWALCKCYAVTTIKMPDSVEQLGYAALAGAKNVKKVSLSKNLVTIYSYAFSGIGADSVKIPASVEYVDSYAFAGYEGSIALEDEYSSVLKKYEGGIYNSNYDTLLFYPKNKSTLTLHQNCTSIDGEAINGCNFKKLVVPEGVTYFSASLDRCKNLTEISFPASLEYIGGWSMVDSPAPKLKKYVVDADNKNYSSYDGCLYDKNREELILVPFTKKEVKVSRGCVTIDYYAFAYDGYTDSVTNEYVSRPKVTLTIAGTVTDIGPLYAVKKAYVECGVTAAGILKSNNDYNNEYGYSTVSYEFTTPSKKILSMIECPDDIQVKKGSKTELYWTYPSGLNVITTALKPSYNNTYAKVTFTSTNKNVAKVNKKTGEVTAVKKGNAVIKAKFVMVDGTTKTFKVKVTVK